MSDGALDLSISSYEPPPAVSAPRPRPSDQASSDSGRASTESTSSDTHDDVKQRPITSSPPRPQISPGMSVPAAPLSGMHIVPHGLAGLAHTDYSSALHPSSLHPRSLPTSSSPVRMNNLPSSGNMSHPNSPETAASSLVPGEDEFKPVLPPFSSSTQDTRNSDVRSNQVRPFKMYPVDAFNMYSSPLVPGSGGRLSPSHVGIQSLYDSSSPSSYPSFPLTPLTSHLLQRKRRLESRDSPSNINNPSSPSGVASSTISISSSVSSNMTGQNAVTTSSVVASSSSGYRGDISSAGSEGEGEKQMKLMGDERKDDAYWDRRRKNNEAAKRSRDARRQKEEEIAMRAAFLEQENLKLRAQVAILKNETAKLHYMLYNRI